MGMGSGNMTLKKTSEINKDKYKFKDIVFATRA